MTKYSIVVVDDQIGRPGPFRRSFLSSVERAEEDFVFTTGQDGEGRNRAGIVIDLVRSLWEGRPNPRASLVLLDVRFDESGGGSDGGRFGFTLLQALRETFGDGLPIVMLTGETGTRNEAGRQRADGFLAKEALTAGSLSVQVMRNGLYFDPTSGLIGEAPAFLLMLRELRRAMASKMMELLVLGETGTGKSENIANYVHQLSGRPGRFAKWFANPSNAELQYSQLFGYWNDAFDKAHGNQAGPAEEAHQGTFFLDEVAELNPDSQSQLLEYRTRGSDGLRRVKRMGHTPLSIRQGQWNLVGQYSAGEDRILVDSLLMCATNRPIDDPAWRQERNFNDALFRGLGHRIRLPPLRERVEDIVPLFLHFVEQTTGRTDIILTGDAIGLLEAHEWREGNVAEVKRVAGSVVSRLGPDFNEVHPHHLEQLLATTRRAPDPPERRSSMSGFADIEAAANRALTERVRTAVLETCRPTQLGTLADILAHATGVTYRTTDVKREVKNILAVWFEPNDRQLARWREHGEYQSARGRFMADPILSALYRYACGETKWDEARTLIDAEIKSLKVGT